MNVKKRISSFSQLGSRLPGLMNDSLSTRITNANNWFTGSEITRAMKSWSSLLTTENLTRWTGNYTVPDAVSGKNVLVITAGNIPLVGFHDFLSVLISGHRFIGKLSSRDDILLLLLSEELIKIEPEFTDQIQIQYFTESPDAVIATGSNNSARYFLKEYGQIPHIIRKNRSSAAILDGNETDGELEKLAADILEYYGLGCRSISHIYLPDGYDPENLIKPISGFLQTDPCEPLNDNLRFQRSRLEMINVPFIDAHKALLVESGLLHSQVGIVHYSFYNDSKELMDHLKKQQNEIQCLAGHRSVDPGLIPFGSAQKPELWDYADRVDTLKFLINLNGL